MAVSIAAETTETWLNLAAQNVLLSLYQKQLSVNETDLSLVKLRFGRGLGSALDVYQQRQQVAAAKAKIPGAMQMRDILKHKLAVLCGHPPRLWEPPSPKSLPDMPALPKTGLPADLLQRRPDVEAARLRVAAAEFRAGAAAAARFPTVRLTADTGFQTARSYLFFEQWVWEILGNLSATLFDAGKKAAEVERTQAVVTERLMDYAETALNAVREVEDALTGERFLRQYYDRLENQVRYAEATLEEARFRYVNGLSDYLTVLTYVKALQSLQTSLVMADRDLLVNRVRLYRALGGAWPETLERAPRVRLKSLEVNP
jgi:NodT family efflux transporter outer membrane factor (OMF) lipoprotein